MPHWRILLTQTAFSAANCALDNAGNNRLARIVITAMTTKSSIKVNAARPIFINASQATPGPTDAQSKVVKESPLLGRRADEPLIYNRTGKHGHEISDALDQRPC